MAKQRQEMLPGGIERYSRSAMYKKRGLHKKLGKPTASPKAAAGAATKTKKVGGDKNGGTRVVAAVKEPRFYPTEDTAVKAKKTKAVRAPKLRASIKPGAVAILLAGRFMGKRVVILKALPSGLLLVSGPFNLNGVPLKRVDPAYVIVTSTTVDISGVNVPAELNDSFFARPGSAKGGEFFEKKEDEGKTVDPKRVAIQKDVDSQLNKSIQAADPLLKDYLRAVFSLRSGQYPHAMKF